MATHVGFRKLDTGEVKTVKVGWSWVLFFFAPILGIPLWTRKVYPYAAAMVGWNLICVLAPASFGTLITGAGIGLSIMWGVLGNKMTAQYYLKNGWELADPESGEADYARTKWALA